MKRKNHLGRGIHAIISSTASDGMPEQNDSIKELDVALIEANPFQPRMVFGEESFEELKRSIQEKGVIQPILVRPIKGDRYQVVAGERRLRASIDLGIKQIPAYVKEITTDEEMLEIALIENVQREQLNPIDLAKGYQQLIDECNLTQEEVAKKIGKDRTTVANIIRCLKLPMKIQESLGRAEIREGHARALLRITDPATLDKIWRRTVKEGLSVRTVEQLARKAEEKTKSKASAIQRRKPPFVARLEKALREKLGTQVKIRTRKGGGSIEISFYSHEDLDRLMGIFEQIKF